MVLGIATGLSLSPTGLALVEPPSAQTAAGWLALPGHVFLALIKMMMVPLVMSSIVLGIASSGDPAQLRRMGFRVAPYFMATTALAVSIGAALAYWIEPGTYLHVPMADRLAIPSVDAADPAEPLPSRIVRLIPTNPLDAVLEERMLQLVVLSILMGTALLSISRERAFIVVELAASMQELTMKVVSWAMLLTPAAVFGLLAALSIDSGFDAILGLSVYVGTVLAGLAVLVAVYVVLIAVFSHQRPSEFLSAIRSVQLLAFSTSSSAAVMPLSMKTAEEQLGVRRSISQFLVPLGATINMDGTALYQAVAAIFLLQVYGVDASASQVGLLLATTIGASIGAPSTPGVGIVVLATVLQSMGIPPAGLGVILGVDRILDMARTAVNVTGDLTACAVVERWLPPDEPGDDAAGAVEVLPLPRHRANRDAAPL